MTTVTTSILDSSAFDVEDEYRDTLDRFHKKIVGRQIAILVPGQPATNAHSGTPPPAFEQIAVALQKIDIEARLVEYGVPGLQKVVSEFDSALLLGVRGVPRDGRIQSYLDMHEKTYTGSGSFAASLVARRAILKLLLKAIGIDEPAFVGPGRDPRKLLNRFELLGYPLPALAWRAEREDGEFPAVLRTGSKEDIASAWQASVGHDLIIEMMPDGVAVSVGILEVKSGWVIMPPIELEGGAAGFFPANEPTATMNSRRTTIDNTAMGHITVAATKVIEHLGCRGAVLLKCLISPNRMRVFDIDVTPTLEPNGLFVKAAEMVGFRLEILLLNLLSSAYRYHRA